MSLIALYLNTTNNLLLKLLILTKQNKLLIDILRVSKRLLVKNT